MASNDTHVLNDPPILFASSVHLPTGTSSLTSQTPEQTCDLTLDEGGTGLADTEAVNSDQCDLGATRAARFAVIAAIEWFSAITAGKFVEFWWAGSDNSNVANGNPGNPDGVDGAWTGDGGGTVAETVLQLQHIGNFVCTDLQGVQKADVGTFSPWFRYGQLIVRNTSGTIICGTDDIESSVLMSPIPGRILAAA